MRELLVREQEVFHRAGFYLRRHAGSFDLVHNHSFSGVPLLLRESVGLPMLTTLHVPPVLLEQLAAIRVLHNAGAPAVLAAVSAALAREYRSLTSIAYVIHNGVDVPDALEEHASDDLLFVGRIAPEKGADLAIAVARVAGRRLVLIGRIEDRTYYEQAVAPHIDDVHVTFLGHQSQPEVWRLMSRAHAVLFTPRWSEPCSLAVLEAMGRGAPAVAFALGGLPEQVVHGTTGFLVSPGNIAAAAEAVARVPELSRVACQAHVRRHFSLTSMVSAYERCYTDLLEGTKSV